MKYFPFSYQTRMTKYRGIAQIYIKADAEIQIKTEPTMNKIKKTMTS